MIELRAKRQSWMTDKGYESIPWNVPHSNLKLAGAIIRIRSSDFRIFGKIYEYNTKGFREIFLKALIWRKLTK